MPVTLLVVLLDFDILGGAPAELRPAADQEVENPKNDITSLQQAQLQAATKRERARSSGEASEPVE